MWNWNRDFVLHTSAQDTFNRTNVELKYCYTGWWYMGNCLLIVPMWIEIDKVNCFHYLGSTFNRTNVELKFVTVTVHVWDTPLLIVPMWNWNEDIGWAWKAEGILLIVPMWNWNEDRLCPWFSPWRAFNRTNVELKYSENKGNSYRGYF